MGTESLFIDLMSEDDAKAELERLGYTGTISEDQSYHKIIRGITMEKDWPDP